MKFYCDKAKIKRKEKIRNLMKWHVVFLWWPIKMSYNNCRWLEFAERRYEYTRYGDFVYYLSHPENLPQVTPTFMQKLALRLTGQL